MKISKFYLYVIFAGIMSGTIIFGGQVFVNAGLSIAQISIIPFLIVSFILLPFVLWRKKSHFVGNNMPLLIFYGAISAFTVICQYSGLILGLPIAVITLLLYSQPLWTTLIARFFLKEKILRNELIACFLVILGVFLLTNFRAGHYSLFSILIALAGGLGLSGWIITGSILSKKGNDPVNSQFSSALFQIIFLLLALAIFNRAITDKNFTDLSFTFSPILWLAIVLYGAIPIAIGQVAYLEGVKKVKAVDAGIIMLLEPVVGTLLAAIFLHQPITLGIIVGGALILIANYLVIINHTNKERML